MHFFQMEAGASLKTPSAATLFELYFFPGCQKLCGPVDSVTITFFFFFEGKFKSLCCKTNRVPFCDAAVPSNYVGVSRGARLMQK